MQVRFSQSFDEDALSDSEDSMRRLSSKPPLAPSGGSVSLAAQHFCPICSIIATSQANLEVMLLQGSSREGFIGRHHCGAQLFLHPPVGSLRQMLRPAGEWGKCCAHASGGYSGALELSSLQPCALSCLRLRFCAAPVLIYSSCRLKRTVTARPAPDPESCTVSVPLIACVHLMNPLY